MRTCASALARSLARCAISSKYLPHSEWSTQVTMRTVWWGQYVSAWSAKITVQGVWRTTKCTLHPSPEEGAVPPLLGAAGDMLSRSHARKVWSVPEPDEHAACTLDAAGRCTTRHRWSRPGRSCISSMGDVSDTNDPKVKDQRCRADTPSSRWPVTSQLCFCFACSKPVFFFKGALSARTRAQEPRWSLRLE